MFKFNAVYQYQKNVQNLQELCYKKVTSNLAAQGDFEHESP
jgi:hypothetical protein